MTVAEFKETAIDSARKYYQYLAQNDKGISMIRVVQIKPYNKNLLWLRLEHRLSFAAAAEPESLCFRYQGITYNAAKDIVPIECSPVSPWLLVRPSPKLYPILRDADPKDLSVFSDLKFLVTRVEGWYTEHGDTMRMPDDLPSPTPPELIQAAPLSDEQLAAVTGALSDPISYIWGAPGTGKTRVVLASCILSLLQSGKRVLILAPTNNALEQTLSGLIPALAPHGIEQDRLLRLGTPTDKFAEQYPTVCEFIDTERLLTYYSSEIKKLKKCLDYRNSRDNFLSAKEQIEPLFLDFSAQAEALSSAHKALASLTQKCAHLNADIELLEHERRPLLAENLAAQKPLSAPLSSVLNFFFPRRRKQILSQIDVTSQRIQNINDRINTLTHDRIDLSFRVSEFEADIDKLSLHLSEIKSELIAISEFWPTLHDAAKTLNANDPSGGGQAFLDILLHGDDLLFDQSHADALYEGQNTATLSERLEKYTALAESLQSRSTEERAKQASVIAATLDKYISAEWLNGSFRPDHVFLDEAGYCPLVKGATLLSLGVPITLLGDHMQLPPICEMNEDDLRAEENRCMSLWTQSVIYLDSAFHSALDDFYIDQQCDQPPLYSTIKKHNLSVTYRFGDSLADILADYIYSPQFRSAATSSTQVLILNAPRRKEDPKRISTSEIEAISKYLHETNIKDFAILTPYRSQLKALARRFPTASEDERTLTVHASQGREWSTVFFSVTDTTDMWFTNTRLSKSKGKQVVNTAVSRAKEQLILVCDRDYWISHPSQLIGQLVQVAERLN